MSGAASDRAAAVFFALSQVPPEQRAALLDERCRDDHALRADVERLLADLDLPDLTSPGLDGTALQAGLTQPSGTVIGDFVVIRQIGAGGTGVVHLAQQRHPPRIVALKMLRLEFLASAVRRRFEIEAELLAHLHHPGIAEIYTAHPGDDRTPPFIAMELVNGPPLTEFADSRKLSTRERVELVARVCDAVQHAHQRGIIHRDLKPGNILVAEDGQPKILDFGVARRLEQASPTTIATEAGQLVGTLAYMSPEQIQANPDAIDTRTDIYTLGVILFRLLAGRLPFAHDEPPLPELARRIVQDDAPRLGTVDPALRGDLEIIVARALSKEKERRYAAAAGLGADLRRYLEGQPISASADSAWYLVRRQIRRYRFALGLSAAAVVAVSVLAFYASVQRSRADRTNVQLEHELATSTIERGRLVSLSGNHPVAEELVWRELFRQPTSRHAQWTLWEIYSREPSLWTHVEHESGTQAVRFSPDGRLLATAGRVDGAVHIIDAESGRLLRTLTAEPRSGLRRALFTPDGASIVTGSEDGSLRLWDVASGALRREIPRAVERLYDLVVAGDGTRVVTVAWGRVQVWSMTTGARLDDLPGLSDKISEGAASRVGPFVVFGTDDGLLTAMDLDKGTSLWHANTQGGLVASLAVSPDGRIVASGGAEGNVNLWDASTGERLRAMPTDNGRVRNLAFDGTGTRLAAAGEWRTRVFDLSQPATPAQDVGGSEGTTDVHFRSDGLALATCHGASGLVRLWYLAADARMRHWSIKGGGITGFGVSSATRDLFIAHHDGVVSFWRGDEPDLRPIVQAGSIVNGLAVSRNGQWLVTVGLKGAAAVWDASSGRRIVGLPDLKASRAVTFSDDGRRIIAGEGDGTLVIWDWSGTSASNPRRIPSSDGEILAVASRDERVFVAHRVRPVVIRELSTGRELLRMSGSAAPFSVAVAPDGRRLASGTYLGTADIWDLETGKMIEGLKGQSALVAGLDFSPDGSLLALPSRDGLTRLWDVAAGQALAVVASRAPGATRALFLPDGRRLAIGYDDGEIEILDLDYFFRFAAGNAEYQLRLFRNAGETFPRADEVLDWSRRILSAR